MVLTVTLNPCLDKSLFVERNAPVVTIRAQETRDLAGGKGVNVARALRGLGVAVAALMPLGGHPGAQVAELAAEEGLVPIAVPIAGVTRSAITVQETPTGETWHYLEPGPRLTPAEVAAVREAFTGAVAEAELVIVSGSVPCAELVPVVPWMVETARAAGRKTIVDTHGPALAAALEARPWMVKPNREELEAAIGFPLDAEESHWRALEALAERGIAVGALSLGAAGLRCLWEGQALAAVPPAVREVNALGCGDSLVAGIARAWLRGEPPEECLRYGTACGAANAAVWDPGGIDAAAVDAQLPGVVVSALERGRRTRA